MKKEIEIKVKVNDFAEVIEKLKEKGCSISLPIYHNDSTFVNYDGDYLAFPDGANYLRIRKTKDEIYFTLKRGSEMNSAEREVKISDADQMREAIEFMGYHEVTNVCKTRIKTTFGEYEICFDDVVGLGKFIEVEKMTNEDPDKVQLEMLNFLSDLGIKIEERVFNGYDTLIYKKNLKTS